MADTVTSEILVDNPQRAVIRLTGVSDGSNESEVLKVNHLDLEGQPTKLEIEWIDWCCDGMVVRVQWDAASNVDAIVLVGTGHFDFCKFGRLRASDTLTGKTGDIDFTTAGGAAGEGYTVIMSLWKK